MKYSIGDLAARLTPTSTQHWTSENYRELHWQTSSRLSGWNRQKNVGLSGHLNRWVQIDVWNTTRTSRLLENCKTPPLEHLIANCQHIQNLGADQIYITILPILRIATRSPDGDSSQAPGLTQLVRLAMTNNPEMDTNSSETPPHPKYHS